jgi:hypothetical protein
MSKGTSCGNGATKVSASPPSRASSAAGDVATRRLSRQPRCWSSRRWGTADLTDVVEHDEGGRSRRDTPAPGLHGTLCPATTVSSPSPEVSPETPTVPSRFRPGPGRARRQGPGALGAPGRERAPRGPRPTRSRTSRSSPSSRPGATPCPPASGTTTLTGGAPPRGRPAGAEPIEVPVVCGSMSEEDPRRPGCGVGPAQRAGPGASSSRTASRTLVSPPSAWALARCRQRVSAGSV